jgi:hypothetical protein
MDILFSKDIKDQLAYIQCTWANCYTKPIHQKSLCIRSYDRKLLTTYQDKSGGVISKLTGNYYNEPTGLNWVEGTLYYCNRQSTGWFRTNDIWFDKKGTKKNPDDQKNIKTQKKSMGWIAWTTGGFTILKLLIG